MFTIFYKEPVSVAHLEPIMVQPETHTKRQATQHGSLSSLLGDGNKRIEIVNGEEKLFCTGRLEQLRLNKNLLYLHDKPNEPTKEDPFHLHSLNPLSPQLQQ
jgi:hypothetical protein